MKIYEYEDGVKLQKYPLLCTYIERMGEGWQAKTFGITLPLWFVLNVSMLFIFPVSQFSWAALIIQGLSSTWFITISILLANSRIKESRQALNKCRNSYISNYGEEPKTFKEIRKM